MTKQALLKELTKLEQELNNPQRTKEEKVKIRHYKELLETDLEKHE